MDKNLFIKALAGTSSEIAIRAENLILENADDRQVVSSRYLEVEHFARLGHCSLEVVSTPRPVAFRYWGGESFDELFSSYLQVVWKVLWKDHEIHICRLEWDTSCGGDSRDWVLAKTNEIAESFILEVCRETHAPGKAILVFSDGSWRRSEALHESTQKASFEDLVMAEDLKSTIRKDFQSFLESEESYTRMGIAWRRGALFVGPPGNGKTHFARALVKELGISSLYVQSLSHPHFTSEQMWQEVFKRARGLRPCVLVLEDLDSLVTDDNRSFFLNQLDGFEQNHGMIVLATTNHPEKIDSAIIDRPSRFDRKYHFNLPAQAEAIKYLQSWKRQLSIEMQWTEDEVVQLASACDGFSFAYLKELIISSVMVWMHKQTVPFVSVALEQADVLRTQMKTEY